MSASDAPSAQAVETVRGLINGHWITQAISVIVRLGIPDRLAPGARSAAELASATGAHEQSLYRVLRTLASIGVLHDPRHPPRLRAGLRTRASGATPPAGTPPPAR